MTVVGWSEVSLYSWIEFGGTIVAMLVCERGFGFRLVNVWEILFCIILFAGFGKERRKGELVNVFLSKWYYGPNI